MRDIFEIVLILTSSYFVTYICHKISIPAVIGQMLIGLLLAHAVLGWIQGSQSLSTFSEIGVILLMFLAGLESNLATLKQNLKISIFVAVGGVVVPLVVFGCVAFLLGRGLTVSFFYGLVFAATSVSISVQVLQEYGKLKSRAGNIILGAAVVDDILAILLLAFFTSGEKSGESLLPKLGLQLLFFVFLIFVHFIIPRVWGMVERLPIFAKNTAMALILCLWLSLLANSVGISSVIGAFFAGLAISQTKPADVIRDNIAMIASVVFEPLFFVSLGISVSLASLIKTPGLILLFVALAIFTKFLPAYYVSRLMGTDRSNSLLIGTGMVSRGEMALIIVQLGLTSHIISDEVYSELVLVIILATFLAPFLMKASLQAKKLDK